MLFQSILSILSIFLEIWYASGLESMNDLYMNNRQYSKQPSYHQSLDENIMEKENV